MAASASYLSYAAKATRLTTHVLVVGYFLSIIDGLSQLPKSGVPLRRVFYEMKVKNSTILISFNTVADKFLIFWLKANIPTIVKP